jgi:hypothetical protein
MRPSLKTSTRNVGRPERSSRPGAFFASLHDAPAVQRARASPPGPHPPPPDWLSAIDGLWPAVEAKVGKIIEAPAALDDAVRAATLTACAPS